MSSPEESQQQQQPEEEVEEEKTSNAATATVVVTPPEIPLEWTQLGVGADESIPLRYPHDVADLDDYDNNSDEAATMDDYMCIVGTAGRKITVIGSDFSSKYNPNMKTLILRSHLISKMEGLEQFTQLETLELYDNMVQSLQCLDKDGCGPKLRILDMSYNVIRDLKPVQICTNLTELYIANNKLKEIGSDDGGALSTLTKLKKIDLGANRIRVIEGLDNLIHLEELWLGKNKIEEISGLEHLTKLRRLDVQSNRLTKVENLTAQVETLEELYLAHNGIDDEGASCETGLLLTFPNLNVLDLSRNRLTTTKSFAHQPSLEELWLSGNNMESFEAVLPLKEAAEAGTQTLETVYLEYNPLASQFDYRKTLAEYIPCLKQIDATLIGGLVAHGMPGVTMSTAPPLQQQLRQYQAAALERAQQQQQESKGEEQETN